MLSCERAYTRAGLLAFARRAHFFAQWQKRPARGDKYGIYEIDVVLLGAKEGIVARGGGYKGGLGSMR